MDFKEKRNGNNVIHLENERRRKQARRTEWRAPQKKQSSDPQNKKKPQGPRPHWTQYLQFFLFIFLLAFMFQQCR